VSWITWFSGFLGGLVGAVAGAMIAGHYTRLETRQRERAARREEWWRRFEWAASLAVSDTEPSKTAGLHVLTTLGESRLAGADEARLLESFSQAVLGVLLAQTEPTPYDVFVLRADPEPRAGNGAEARPAEERDDVVEQDDPAQQQQGDVTEQELAEQDERTEQDLAEHEDLTEHELAEQDEQTDQELAEHDELTERETQP
jgi:hypothetical protein